MRSLLDGKTWFLDDLTYTGALHLVLVEGKLGDPINIKQEGIKEGSLAKVLQGSRPIEIQEDSACVRVDFEEAVAWQVVNESYTAWDDYEIRDHKSSLQVLSQSRYLDYVNEYHGWYKDIVGPAEHYRICTENEIIDVVAFDPPAVEMVDREQA